MGSVVGLGGMGFTPEQGKWKRLARRLAQETLAPNAAAIDRDGVFPAANFRELATAGLMGLTIPESMGGAGHDCLTAVLVTEELAQGCASTAMCYHMHMSTVPLLVALARPDQVAEFVTPVARGERFGTLAMSEAGSGNRLWHTDSFLEDDGNGGFVLDARKSFVTSSRHADYYLVSIRPSADAKPHEISLFVVDGRDPHIEPQGTWDGMGMRGNCSTPVHFNGCRVSSRERLSTPACGFSTLFAYSFPAYQLGLSAVYLGIAQAAFDLAVKHVKSRVHSDTAKTLAHVETVQRYVAEMKLRIDMARSVIYRLARLAEPARLVFDQLAAADLLDDVIIHRHDDPYFGEIAGVKVVACEAAAFVVNAAMQICGGTAYRRGTPLERLYRDARAGSVMAPADDTLKLLVARQVLGVPQPWQ